MPTTTPNTTTPNSRPERKTPSYKELAYWQDTAAKRVRLCWATGIFGGMLGFLLHAIISMPPVWL